MFQFSLDLKKIAFDIFRQTLTISGLAQLSNQIFSKVSFHPQWRDTALRPLDDYSGRKNGNHTKIAQLFKINSYFHELRYPWYLICLDCVPCLLAPNL